MKTKFYIGTSGWNYDDWQRRFYPKNLNSREWLEFYCKKFESVEVNMTFYRWPREIVLKNWYKRTPKNFKFTLKAPRTITHVRKLNNIERVMKDFYKLADLLKEKLACILFQLPPSFSLTDENLKRVKNFLKLLKGKRNVIEFRHESWWNQEIYNLLKNKIAFCVVSGIDLPENIILTNKILYARFHCGSDNANYTNRQLKNWANKIKKSVKENKEQKIKEVYCYFNNDTRAYAVYNALELREKLKS